MPKRLIAETKLKNDKVDRIKNRIHQLLAQQGIYSTWTDPFGKGGRQFILSQNTATETKKQIAQFMAYLDQLDLAIAERLGRITRHGSEHLRTILVEAAHRVRPAWGALYEFFIRIKEKKDSETAKPIETRERVCVSWPEWQASRPTGSLLS